MSATNHISLVLGKYHTPNTAETLPPTGIRYFHITRQLLDTALTVITTLISRELLDSPLNLTI